MSCVECEKKERKLRELHEKADHYHIEALDMRTQRNQLQKEMKALKESQIAEELKHIIRRARVILNEVL